MNDNFDSFNATPKPPQSGQPAPREMASIAKIAEALSKAQAEIVQPEKNKTVKVRTKTGQEYTFDYADYNAIVEAVRIPLSKQGICFTHLIEAWGQDLVLMTRLIHSSGEFLESVYPLPNTTDPKDLGGAITYGKRYCLSAITGCVADDDADAEPKNVTDFKDRKAPAKVIATAHPTDQKEGERPAPSGPPSQAQIARLFTIAGQAAWSHEHVKQYLITRWKIESTKDLTRERYDALISVIQNKTFQTACAQILGEPKV